MLLLYGMVSCHSDKYDHLETYLSAAGLFGWPQSVQGEVNFDCEGRQHLLTLNHKQNENMDFDMAGHMKVMS